MSLSGKFDIKVTSQHVCQHHRKNNSNNDEPVQNCRLCFLYCVVIVQPLEGKDYPFLSGKKGCPPPALEVLLRGSADERFQSGKWIFPSGEGLCLVVAIVEVIPVI